MASRLNIFNQIGSFLKLGSARKNAARAVQETVPMPLKNPNVIPLEQLTKEMRSQFPLSDKAIRTGIPAMEQPPLTSFELPKATQPTQISEGVPQVFTEAPLGSTTQKTGVQGFAEQLAGLSDEDKQLLGLTETPEQKTQREAITDSLNRLITLRGQLAQTEAPSEDIIELDRMINEQNRALQDLTPEGFLKTQRGLQDVGITQQQLERTVAKEREPIARALSDLLLSRSVMGEIQKSKVQGIQSQIGAIGEEIDIRQALSELGKGTQLPEAVRSKVFEGLLKTPEEVEAGQLDLASKRANLARTQAETQKVLNEIRVLNEPTDPQMADFLVESVLNRKVDLVGNELTKEEKAIVKQEFNRRGLQLPRALTTREKDAQPDAISALAAVDEIERIYNDDSNILAKNLPSIFGRIAGASKFKTAISEATDVKTRIRTGAALNESEIAFYKAQAPQFGDTKEDVDYKLNQLRGFYLGMSGLPVTIINPGSGEAFTFQDLFEPQQRLGLRKAINEGYGVDY